MKEGENSGNLEKEHEGEEKNREAARLCLCVSNQSEREYISRRSTIFNQVLNLKQ